MQIEPLDSQKLDGSKEKTQLQLRSWFDLGKNDLCTCKFSKTNEIVHQKMHMYGQYGPWRGKGYIKKCICMVSMGRGEARERLVGYATKTAPPLP
jgi:hypothetical protein